MRKLAQEELTLGRTSIASPGTGAQPLRIALEPRAKLLLARLRRAEVTIRLAATDARRNRTVVERVITLQD